MSLGLITYLVWTVFLIKRMIKPRREEEGETEKETLMSNISIQGKKGKFLLCVMISEVLTITFYDIAAVLGYVLWEFPEFRILGIRWNISCSSEIADYISWLEELQFPEVSFFVRLGRSNLLITIALATSFIQFVTNSYVTESWKYKRILKGVWLAIPLCILTVVFGTIPQTMIIMWAVDIIVLIIYFGLIIRSIAFLNKALSWREQDLKCYDERENLWRHRRVASKFRVSMRLIMIGFALLIFQDTVELIIMVLGIFLFYGKCVFPSVYGIAYTAPIQPGALASFRLGLRLANLFQGIVLVAATGFLLLPQVAISILIPLYSCFKAVNGGDKRNIRFHIMREPLISTK